MKHLTILVALVLPAGTASAQDFRSLNFGESCLEVESKEYHLGNSPRAQSKETSAVFEFNGVFLDRSVTIVYHCDGKGLFKKGAYIFEITSETDLETFFAVAKPNLENLLGPPAFDGSKMIADQRYDSFAYALRWDEKRATINVKVVGNFDGLNSHKQLQIWFRPAR